MAGIKSILLITIIVLFTIFHSCIAAVAYVKYSRKIPSKYRDDKYVEEIIEEFHTINRPPEFGSSEQDIENIFRNDQSGSKFRESAPVTLHPVLSTMPKITTPPSAHHSIFSWFDSKDTKSTTSSPTIFTTKFYNNRNLDFPPITSTIIKTPSTTSPVAIPASTTEQPEATEYYDNYDSSRTTEATGPTKVTFSTIIETEKNAAVPDADEDDYGDYDEDYSEDPKDVINSNITTSTASTGTVESPTKLNLSSLFE